MNLTLRPVMSLKQCPLSKLINFGVDLFVLQTVKVLVSNPKLHNCSRSKFVDYEINIEVGFIWLTDDIITFVLALSDISYFWHKRLTLLIFLLLLVFVLD